MISIATVRQLRPYQVVSVGIPSNYLRVEAVSSNCDTILYRMDAVNGKRIYFAWFEWNPSTSINTIRVVDGSHELVNSLMH